MSAAASSSASDSDVTPAWVDSRFELDEPESLTDHAMASPRFSAQRSERLKQVQQELSGVKESRAKLKRKLDEELQKVLKRHPPFPLPPPPPPTVEEVRLERESQRQREYALRNPLRPPPVCPPSPDAKGQPRSDEWVKMFRREEDIKNAVWSKDFQESGVMEDQRAAKRQRRLIRVAALPPKTAPAAATPQVGSTESK
jgi:hypothetical protein